MSQVLVLGWLVRQEQYKVLLGVNQAKTNGLMVAVAQLVESHTVTVVVAGSNPVGHPKLFSSNRYSAISIAYITDVENLQLHCSEYP